ncbi:MAG: YjjG family noncanonical pyrimidine nucleotidase [Bacteroidales bacterium]
MKNYRHLFFDLDNTLWDFNNNSAETLRELFREYIMHHLPITAETFIEVYEKINHELWEQYRKGQITKEDVALKRFALTLNHWGLADESLARVLSEAYIRRSPLKTRLIDGAEEVLEILRNRYRLHIITNGFIDVQFPKIELSGLVKYFSTITPSEECGCLKPCRRIFELALQKAGAHPQESLMVGDDPEGDIRGAYEAGMDTVFYNINGVSVPPQALYHIRHLKELISLLEQ